MKFICKECANSCSVNIIGKVGKSLDISCIIGLTFKRAKWEHLPDKRSGLLPNKSFQKEWYETAIKNTIEGIAEAMIQQVENPKKEPKKENKITATKIFTFDSAHYLIGHPGLCKNIHGHTYKLEVTFQKDPEHSVSESNPPDMVMDFSEMKKLINEIIIDKLDHQLINEVPAWLREQLRPTAENMVEVFAKWIMKHNRGWFKNNLVSIRLWETPTSYVTWIKEE